MLVIIGAKLEDAAPRLLHNLPKICGNVVLHIEMNNTDLRVHNMIKVLDKELKKRTADRIMWRMNLQGV